jgi:hypothetical protein
MGEVAKVALVHDAVSDGRSPAIYVARRSETLWYIGGPDFTETQKSDFLEFPLAQALKLDTTFPELERLAVGECAYRISRSQPWSFGAAPVGTTFFLNYELRPGELNPEKNEIGGSFASCWIVTDSIESALRTIHDELVENHWSVVRQLEADAVTEDDHDNTYFRQAQIDGVVILFQSFPPDAAENNYVRER